MVRIKNSYIASFIQYLKSECDLAWEQTQHGGSIDARYEGTQAYIFFSQLLEQIEQDYDDIEGGLNDYHQV